MGKFNPWTGDGNWVRGAGEEMCQKTGTHPGCGLVAVEGTFRSSWATNCNGKRLSVDSCELQTRRIRRTGTYPLLLETGGHVRAKSAVAALTVQLPTAHVRCLLSVSVVVVRTPWGYKERDLGLVATKL